MPTKDEEQSVNIFDLLSEEAPEEEKKVDKTKSRRAELLEPMGIKDCFEEGSISIDMRTCRGIECNLCVKACPTNALYWKAGEIGIVEDLCIHCTACVANCMVDDCIRVTRKRPDGKTERFSNAKDVCKLLRNINLRKGKDRVKSLFRTPEEYFERYGK
ncbi:MAG: 4Fe-4S dicluster domain-containing protein [Candidatus Bathyarchaeota archaeon]|nr:4Fe-4S dicluster domain-containing protein [Candidatus Bathyarchaeum sp.]